MTQKHKKLLFVKYLLRGDLSKTQLFDELTRQCNKSICCSIVQMEAELKVIYDGIQRRGDDLGTHNLIDEIVANCKLDNGAKKQRLLQIKQLYNKAASIAIEDGYLICFATSLDEQKWSTNAESEFVQILDQRYILHKIAIKIPDPFLKSDLELDNLFATWVLKVLSKHNLLIAGVIAQEIFDDDSEVINLWY